MFELFSTILAQSQTAPSEGTSKVLTPTVLLGIFLVGAALVLAITWRIRTVHLALGFATTVLMWAVGYFAMLAPGMWIGEALFSVTLCIPVAFGWIARRGGASPAKVGLVSALANLLVIGAFLRDEQQGSALTPVLYVVGLFAVSTALAVFGGFLASHFSRKFARHLSRKFAQPIALPSSVGLLAIVAAVAVFLLLVTGGLVTSLESGLAVPDWPNSFGHNMLLYPISQMKGGIYYEHAHRLFGMLVGVTALVMLGVVWREDSRRLVRMLAIAFIVIVCAQGLLRTSPQHAAGDCARHVWPNRFCNGVRDRVHRKYFLEEHHSRHRRRRCRPCSRVADHVVVRLARATFLGRELPPSAGPPARRTSRAASVLADLVSHRRRDRGVGTRGDHGRARGQSRAQHQAGAHSRQGIGSRCRAAGRTRSWRACGRADPR